MEGLQIGRGLAALAVVIFHTKLTLIRFPESSYIKLPYFYDHGDIGVPFFFVISGFIICLVMSRPSFSSGSFLLKRVFRLWPTYAFCTILYVALYLVHRNLPATEVGYGPAYILKSLVFWPMGPLPALHPGWSLEHEILFYLLAAFVGIFRGPTALLIVLITSVFVGFVLRNFSSALNGFDYHFFAVSNVCFAAGALLFLIWQDKKPDKPLFYIVLGIILLIITPYLIELLPKHSSSEFLPFEMRTWKYTASIINSLASCILLYGLLSFQPVGLVSRGLVYLGDRSYSLYLIHFCFIPVFQYVHRELVKWPEWMAEPLCILFVLLSIVAAELLYRAIEAPSGKFGAKLAYNRAKHDYLAPNHNHK